MKVFRRLAPASLRPIEARSSFYIPLLPCLSSPLQSTTGSRPINMLRFVALFPRIRFAAAPAMVALLTVFAQAQFSTPSRGTQVHDPSALKPPAGARVAIVEFE